MGKTKSTGAVASTVPVVRYTIVPPKRPLTGVKFGTNADTHAALAEAAKGGTLTYAEVHAVCVARNHPGFARYAVRRGWAIPAVA